jgi:hypothetical protein
VAGSGCFAKCGDGKTTFGHRREHLIMGEIEDVVAWLEPKELEWGRISMRQRRPASTRHGRGKKWWGGPWFWCGGHAEEGVGCLVKCVVHGKRRGGGPAGVKHTDAVACQ